MVKGSFSMMSFPSRNNATPPGRFLRCAQVPLRTVLRLVRGAGLNGAVLVVLAVLVSLSQMAANETPVDNTGMVENPKPTWETQRQARTFFLSIPAPRGQITDRHGRALAQNRLSYNLAINFPAQEDWTDEQILQFARQQAALASQLVGRQVNLNEAAVVNHFRNRSLLPFDIIEDLSPRELSAATRGVGESLLLRQVYLRYYPHGHLGAHFIGYVGRVAPLSLRPIENRDLIFPDSEGREGLEKIFNDQLTGIPGELHMTFNEEGVKVSERVARPPVPGNNVITTIDLDLQRICEEVLAKGAKRGAIAVVEVGTGEVLALASWPTFNPNLFIPVIKSEDFNSLQNDPNVPLLPRAFRSAYPPGSTFKTITGLAALQSGAIQAGDKFNCPPSLAVGNVVFRNWKKEGAGMLDFVQAMAQSCNTYFYQVGLRTGGQPIVDWAFQTGLGRRTGLPLEAESAGNVPTDEYMLRVHRRRILQGDVANLSIGQGDLLITPVQMAQAMGILANNGAFPQTRLVKQIQALDNKVVAAYPNRLRDQLNITPENLESIRESLVAVTEGGTGGRARVKGVEVAGKTGTAQWGPKTKQRTAAWFAGFLPADNPQFAFAAVYESDPNVKAGGGSHAAPLIGKVFAEYLPLLVKSGRAPEAAPNVPVDVPPEELLEEAPAEGEAVVDESG